MTPTDGMPDQDHGIPQGPVPAWSRREMLTKGPSAFAGLLLGAGALGEANPDFQYLTPEPGTNPLETYPNRDWEDVYRNLYKPDSTYHYMCGPNDTHGCLLHAKVKNGVVVYADPSFNYHKTTDVYGNKASARWDPRACISGLSYVRRTYADRRVKGNYIRKGFKDWVDAGFPRDAKTGMPDAKYREGRGKEDFVKMDLDELASVVAKTLLNISETYSGAKGAAFLKEQGYDEAMIEAMHEAGTQTLKHRGGMPYNAPIRIAGMYRFANMEALIDAHVREVEPEEAIGGRHWDSYAWHTDLPPGHPMVSGQQTIDFDLYTAENSKLITLWGMNWIATKMPDGHWLSEARLHGAKVVTIAPEYQSSTTKADESLIIRPGSDGALALGLASVIVNEELYDADFVRSFTDLPLLVRSDTSELLKAKEVFPNYTNVTLVATGLNEGKLPMPPSEQGKMYLQPEMREKWGDFVVWDSSSDSPKAISRDEVGKNFGVAGAALEGKFNVTLADGKSVECRPVFDAVKEYLLNSCSPADVEKITWVPAEAIEQLARDIAAHPAETLFVEGMGGNHWFNNDLSARAIILVASLTNNVGHYGGTVGCYSGNYRLPNFSGLGQWLTEDPFDPELDRTKPARIHKYYKGESAHYYNYGDRPLRIGNKMFTGETHMPTPTKSVMYANGNSLLGNAKGAHNMFINVIPKIEMIAIGEWFWTASCEYSDVIFGVDSWPERKLPDIFGSSTNPFLHAWVETPLPRIYDTHDDVEVWAAIAKALAAETGDQRFSDYWKFIEDGDTGSYIQRVFDAGNATKGYKFDDLHESCKEGTPFFMMLRTSPKIIGWEQTQESKPWYTRSGRLEFYRDEKEFIEYGENLPVYREPVDGTHHEPNVILGKPHPLLNPKPLEEYGDVSETLEVEVRQVRNLVMTADEIAASHHPRVADGFTHVLLTPKYRHACHSMGASVDTDVVIWGPFGDFYRHDKRKPWNSEGYVDIHPDDAKELGVQDGDYVWVDADPQDRPFVGHEDRPDDYKVTRWLVRARHNLSVARGVARSWFHFYVATHGSVEGHETREDGLAKNPRTGYQAGYRYGSHQSVTRAWLRPTLMVDTLARKEGIGQMMGEGFELDVYGTVGAPKESFVKITRAEPGGEDGEGEWRPLAQGHRPEKPSDPMSRYLEGGYYGGDAAAGGK